MKDPLQLSIEEVQRRWTPLSAWEERALFTQLALGHASEQKAAEEELSILFAPIAYEEAFNYVSRAKRDGSKLLDFTQEACVAGWQAITTFDPGRGNLQPHIWIRMLTRQHLDKVLLGANHLVTVRTQDAESVRRLRAVRAEYEAEHGYEPDRTYLVRKLRITPDALEQLLLLDAAPLPLDNFAEGGTPFSELLVDKSQDPCLNNEQTIMASLVREVVKALPNEHKVVLQGYLDGHTVVPELLEPALACFTEAYCARTGISL